MQSTWKLSSVAGALALTSVLALYVNTSRDVSPDTAVGAAPRAYPGYYYSPGGYSGGFYFSPGYYPNPRSTRSNAGTTTYYGSPSVGARGRSSVNYYDPTTGRTNLAIPLSKPWLGPLR